MQDVRIPGRDGYAPRATVQALVGLFPSAPVEVRAVRPSDAGAGRIGHFGFFRERFRATLWKDAADWLAERR